MKISECDHDFEKCEISNPYNYDFNEFKSRNANQRFHPYYCKKCGMLILKRVVDNGRGIDKFLDNLPLTRRSLLILVLLTIDIGLGFGSLAGF